MADIPDMEHNALATATPRRGRPCAVCSMPTQQRTALELALAQGVSISRIARQHHAPGRDSIRHHVQAGHLPAQLQQQAERAQGLDYTTVIARIAEIAQRARITALEAAEAGDRAGVVRAGDAELRALSVLATSGETSEHEIGMREAYRDSAHALFRVARRDPQTAERVAAELDAMYRPILAEDLRDQIPVSEIER